MPGTIRVSVLEAVDLPAGATDGKYVSVKVSVGKREFQTKPSKTDSGKTTPWNSDFAFPVLNLRDNLVVVLLDSKGDQIAQNEIDTPSIVERGLRDEFLTLKGGGSIHLRLSFVLTDEERRRIEVMRAAALKKREQETLKKNVNNQALQPTAENGKSPSVPNLTITGSRPEETYSDNKENRLDGAASELSSNSSNPTLKVENVSNFSVETEATPNAVMEPVQEQTKESPSGFESRSELEVVISPAMDQRQKEMEGSAVPSRLQEALESPVLGDSSEDKQKNSTSSLSQSSSDPSMLAHGGFDRERKDATHDFNVDASSVECEHPSVKPVVEETLGAKVLEITALKNRDNANADPPVTQPTVSSEEECPAQSEEDCPTQSDTGHDNDFKNLFEVGSCTSVSLQPSSASEPTPIADAAASEAEKTSPFLKALVDVEGTSAALVDSNVWNLQASKDGSISPTPLIGFPFDAVSVAGKNIPLLDLEDSNISLLDLGDQGLISMVSSADTTNSPNLPASDSIKVDRSTKLHSSSGILSPEADATCPASSINEVVYESNEASGASSQGASLESAAMEALRSFSYPSSSPVNLVYPSSNTVSVKEVTKSPTALLQTSESSQMTPNSVKEKVKAFESSFSQDSDRISPLLASQSSRLHAQKSVERLRSDARRNLEEEGKKEALEEERKSLDVLRVKKQMEEAYGSMGSVEFVAEEERHVKDGRLKSNEVEERILYMDMAQGLLIPDAADQRLKKSGNMNSDLIVKSSKEETKTGEYSAFTGEQENRNLNSSGIINVAKQVFGGAMVVAVGALFIWARATNSNKRRASIAQKSQGKKRK